tara:strand:- start:9940 stop:10269 length:330 start_codon:yes stop_codon:yes gene_type:complete
MRFGSTSPPKVTISMTCMYYITCIKEFACMDGKAFSTTIIHYGQALEPTAVVKLVRAKIHAPASTRLNCRNCLHLFAYLWQKGYACAAYYSSSVLPLNALVVVQKTFPY